LRAKYSKLDMMDGDYSAVFTLYESIVPYPIAGARISLTLYMLVGHTQLFNALIQLLNSNFFRRETREHLLRMRQ